MEVKDIERLGEIINDPKNQVIKARRTVLEPITMRVHVDVYTLNSFEWKNQKYTVYPLELGKRCLMLKC